MGSSGGLADPHRLKRRKSQPTPLCARRGRGKNTSVQFIRTQHVEANKPFCHVPLNASTCSVLSEKAWKGTILNLLQDSRLELPGVERVAGTKTFDWYMYIYIYLYIFVQLSRCRMDASWLMTDTVPLPATKVAELNDPNETANGKNKMEQVHLEDCPILWHSLFANKLHEPTWADQDC